MRPYRGPACTRDGDDSFEREVWDNVGAVRCVQCHQPGSDAEESALILEDPRKLQGHARADAMRHNRDAFARLARAKEGDRSRLLVKATGGLDHGGGDVLKPGSKGYLILAEFVRKVDAPPSATPRVVVVDDEDRRPFFDGVAMLDARRLLRRVTLSLAGRLPTASEMAAVDEKGLDGLPPLLDALMKEEPSTNGSAKGSMTSSSRSASMEIRRPPSSRTSISRRRACGPRSTTWATSPRRIARRRVTSSTRTTARRCSASR